MGVGWGGRIKNNNTKKLLDIIILVSYEVGNGGIFPVVARRHGSTYTYACHSCDKIAVVCVHTEYSINWNVQLYSINTL